MTRLLSMATGVIVDVDDDFAAHLISTGNYVSDRVQPTPEVNSEQDANGPEDESDDESETETTEE